MLNIFYLQNYTLSEGYRGRSDVWMLQFFLIIIYGLFCEKFPSYYWSTGYLEGITSTLPSFSPLSKVKKSYCLCDSQDRLIDIQSQYWFEIDDLRRIYTNMFRHSPVEIWQSQFGNKKPPPSRVQSILSWWPAARNYQQRLLHFYGCYRNLKTLSVSVTCRPYESAAYCWWYRHMRVTP